MRPTMRLGSGLVAMALLGCGAAPPPPRSSLADDSARGPGAAGDTSADLRAPRTPTRWADLLQRLRQGRIRPVADAGCLLTEDASGAPTLGLPLAPAVQPLPPPVAAEGQLAAAERITVLTRWGPSGADRADLVVATLTHLPPGRDLRLLLVTRRDLRLLDAEGGGRAHTLPSLGALPAALRDAGGRDTEGNDTRPAELRVLVVVPDASVRLYRLEEVLTALDDLSPRPWLALGFVLPLETRLPARSPAGTFACDTRSEAPRAATSASTSEPSERRRELADEVALRGRLGQMAADCLRAARQRGAAPGRLTLRLDLSTTGELDACLEHDEPGDPRLAACLVQPLRATRLLAPPAEPVTLRLPMRLAGSVDWPAPRALCPVAEAGEHAGGGPSPTTQAR